MRIIITGGSGLIGRQLTTQLASQGHEVIILSRTPQAVQGLPPRARAELWDGRTAAGWGHLVHHETTIINLAGANIGDKRWTAERKQLIVQSRVEAGQAVVAAVEAAEHKPAVVIQASAIGYYGNRADEPLPETAAPGTDFLANVCVLWEEAIAPVASHSRLITIRTGVVLTTTGGALAKMLLPFKLFAGGAFGSGQQWFPWIHVDDEIAAILHLWQHPTAAGPFNLVSPNILRNKEFAKVLGKVMSRPAIAPVPAFALKLALGEMAALVLDGQRVIPQRLLETGFQFTYPEPEAALSDILAHQK